MKWAQLAQTRSDLTEAGRGLLYQFSVGLGFLGTVRADGGPRLHPVCPVITDDGMYVFVEPGPKRDDLHRDPRCALHSFPPDRNEDAFYVTGTATQVTDEATIARLRQQMRDERPTLGTPPDTRPADELFELDIERVLLTRTTGHGDWEPQHTIWHE